MLKGSRMWESSQPESFLTCPAHTHTHTTQMGKDKTLPQLVFTNVRVNFKLSDGLRGSWWFFGFVIFYLGVFSPHN